MPQLCSDRALQRTKDQGMSQMPLSKDQTVRRIRITSDTLYFSVVAAIIGFWLLLPVFPSGDGGGHLYYSHVLDKVLHNDPLYSHYYSIRHLFGPYALHYFSLIALERLVSADLAERLFVVITVLNLGLAFRFLAQTLGKNAGVASLLIVPFLMPWAMAAGFMNFCFAVGLLLWCLGFWERLREPRCRIYFVGFAFGVVLLVFSHPIPLMLLILLCAIDLFLTVLSRIKHRNTKLFTDLALPIVSLFIACVAFIFPILIADKSRIAGEALRIGLHVEVVRAFVYGLNLTMFGAKPSIVDRVFRLVSFIVMPAAAFLVLRGVRRRWAQNTLTTSDRLVTAALIVLGLTLLLPERINGSAWFPHRMWWILWLVIIATASGAALGRRLIITLLVTGCFLTALTAHTAWTVIPPVAGQLATIDQVKLPTGRNGLFLESPNTLKSNGLNYWTFQWSGARAFMHSNAVLLNSPWMGITISPLKPEPASDLMINYASEETVEQPSALMDRLIADPELKKLLLSKTDFIYYIDPNDLRPSPSQDIGRLLGSDSGLWNCQAGTIYALCQKIESPAERLAPR